MRKDLLPICRMLCALALATCIALSPLHAEPFHPAVSKGSLRARNGSPSEGRARANSDFRFYSLSNYRRFPVSVRRLMRRSDMEQYRCRNGRGDNPSTYHSCNRSWRASVELERRGWCYGNERNDAIMADFHWLRCTRDRTSRPGQLGAHPPYSDREVHGLSDRSGRR